MGRRKLVKQSRDSGGDWKRQMKIIQNYCIDKIKRERSGFVQRFIRSWKFLEPFSRVHPSTAHERSKLGQGNRRRVQLVRSARVDYNNSECKHFHMTRVWARKTRPLWGLRWEGAERLSIIACAPLVMETCFHFKSAITRCISAVALSLVQHCAVNSIRCHAAN